MRDMFDREVNVGDIVVFYGGWHLELMRITRFNPHTTKISLEPVDKSGRKTGPGKSSNYGPKKLLLVRDIDLVTT